jgi:porphobilinogen synthase
MTASMSLRRLRQSSAIRELVREVRVVPEQLIQPHFVVEGLRAREPVPGMTDVHRETGDTLAATVESDLEAGVAKVLLFGVPAEKRNAEFSHDFTAGQIESLRRRFGRSLWIAVDVCLCSHTRHGHCGVLDREGEHVENGATVTELARAATLFAEAGADCVAPSDMMDGRIGALRAGLDAAGLERTLVMSYAAKFHSRFYGPFRVAAESAPQSGPKDRASYQIDPARPNDALQCALRDAREGADILMVKPGLPYLDVLAELSRRVELPWAVYEVSGEYAAVELLAAQGLTARAQAHVEIWTAFARAGASIIITYGARHARQWLEASRS